MPLSLLFLLAGTLLLAACTSFPNPDERRQQASMLAHQQNWQALQLQGGAFRLQAFAPQTRGDELTIYLEGDGFAWISARQPSSDPTPLDPIALRLALAQPRGNAAYLGRPCQYLDTSRPPCQRRYWTDARFAEEVVQSLDQAVDQLKDRAGARRLVLIGYSGGGTLTLLLASRRHDVKRIVTIAGNLDHSAWTHHHRISALKGSLNTAALRARLANVEQFHLVGDEDRIIPPQLSEAFLAGYPPGHRAQRKVVPGYDHRCCWAQDWPVLWEHIEAGQPGAHDF